MGFLDTIGQRGSESRPPKSPPDVDPYTAWNESDRAIQTSEAKESPRSTGSNRIPVVVLWGAALIVVAAVAVAAWLGMRHFPKLIVPRAEAEAEAPAAAPPPVEKPAPKQGSVRRRATARSAPKAQDAIDAVASRSGLDTTNETAAVSAGGPAGEVANVTRTEEAPPVSEPVIAALAAEPPQDDFVYSTEGTGVVAPQLVSLGFVRGLLRGFEARTSTLELIVSKSGTVERAKIFPPSRNWEDAMLLSRAKTFQFVPAQRNGFPVRYRVFMEVDATP